MGKKELAKRSAKGEKLIFDDEGVPHQLYEVVKEEDFLKDGDAKTQRDEYINEKGELMKAADIDDKALAKEKRQEKKLKRKMREQEVSSFFIIKIIIYRHISLIELLFIIFILI